MSQSKAAKKSLLYTAKGFKPYQPSIFKSEPIKALAVLSREQAKPLIPAHEKMLPIVDPQVKTLDELKVIAKDLNIKGWNFYKDPVKLQSKINDQIRFSEGD